MKIALFGTSADPPTAGHQAIIRWLSEHYDWVAVWAADNPFKSHRVSIEHRVAMLRLLIAQMDSVRRNIGVEQQLSAMRSLETVEKAKVRWGNDAEFTLVVGSDLLTQLPRWYRVEDLLQQVHLLVMQRPGYAVDRSSLDTLLDLGGRIAIANFMGLDVSSTAYREHSDAQVLTRSVFDYIQREHLYQWLSNLTI